jgi:hypothetical protein
MLFGPLSISVAACHCCPYAHEMVDPEDFHEGSIPISIEIRTDCRTSGGWRMIGRPPAYARISKWASGQQDN